MERIKTTIWMPRDKHDQLVAEASRRGWTMSYVINGLVEKWLEAIGSQAGAQGDPGPDRRGAV